MVFFSKKATKKEKRNNAVEDNNNELSVATIENVTNDDRNLPLAISQLRTINNRLFLLLFVTFFALILSVMFSWNRASKADKNQQLLYIQMWDSGDYKVLDALPDDVLITKNIINSLLEKYIKLRHGQIPQSIVVDYDDATTFMSNNLYEDFINRNGFNAPEKVKNIKDSLKKGTAETIEIVYRSEPEHYDAVEGLNLHGEETVIMRTNMYVTKTTRNAQGKVINTQYNIHRLQWHLVDKTELSVQESHWLSINPIGIVIIADDVIIDKVATEKANMRNKNK